MSFNNSKIKIYTPYSVIPELKKNNNLKKLYLWGLDIYSDQFIDLCNILKDNKTVKEIEIDHITKDLTDPLINMLKINQTIDHIEIGNRNEKKVVYNKIGELLKTNKSIKSFSYYETKGCTKFERNLWNGLEINKSIIYLTIGNTSLANINKFIQNNKTVKNLFIKLYRKQNVNNLLEHLKYNNSIKNIKIDISNTSIFSISGKYLSDIISNNTIKYFNIISNLRFQINNQELIFEALKKNSRLKYFTIDNLLINRSNIKKILDICESNTTLQKIRLTINDINNINLFSKINCDIELKLIPCLDMLETLTKLLEISKNIIGLVFIDCYITVPMIVKLIKSLKRNKSVKYIHFAISTIISTKIVKKFVATDFNRKIKLKYHERSSKIKPISILIHKKNYLLFNMYKKSQLSMLDKTLLWYMNRTRKLIRPLSKLVIKSIYRTYKKIPSYLNRDIKHSLKKYKLKKDIAMKY